MIEIKHRYTDVVLRTVEDLRGADLVGADLGGAYLRDADLGDADLRGADLRDADLGGADLGGADLGGADLRGAYLRDADLRRADLRRADLRVAYLGDADLRGADLRDVYLRGADLRDADLGDQWIIQGATSSQGYAFFLERLTRDGAPMIKAGCFRGTIGQARARWSAPDYHRGAVVGQELIEIVDSLVRIAEIRGLMK